MGFRIGAFRFHIASRWGFFGFKDFVLVGIGIYYSKPERDAYLSITLFNINACAAWDPL